MPHVWTSYEQGLFREPFFQRLKAELRQRLAGLMSVPGISLSEDDFSFKFFEEGRHDELNKDLEIIIFAHDDEQGARAEMGDRLAALISNGVARVLEMEGQLHVRRVKPITFSVTVQLGKMSYFSSEAETRPTMCVKAVPFGTHA